MYFPTKPNALRDKYKDMMSENILHRIRTIQYSTNLNFTPEICNKLPILIENICLLIANEVLANLCTPTPNKTASNLFNRDMQREKSYNILVNDLTVYVSISEPKLM